MVSYDVAAGAPGKNGRCRGLSTMDNSTTNNNNTRLQDHRWYWGCLRRCPSRPNPPGAQATSWECLVS